MFCARYANPSVSISSQAPDSMGHPAPEEFLIFKMTVHAENLDFVGFSPTSRLRLQLSADQQSSGQLNCLFLCKSKIVSSMPPNEIVFIRPPCGRENSRQTTMVNVWLNIFDERLHHFLQDVNEMLDMWNMQNRKFWK